MRIFFSPPLRKKWCSCVVVTQIGPMCGDFLPPFLPPFFPTFLCIRSESRPHQTICEYLPRPTSLPRKRPSSSEGSSLVRPITFIASVQSYVLKHRCLLLLVVRALPWAMSRGGYSSLPQCDCDNQGYQYCRLCEEERRLRDESDMYSYPEDTRYK